MGRIIRTAAGVYLGAAIATRAMEANGVYRCACLEDCWCKRPGLNLFRWVFPYGHSLRASD
jgi:hypothetical protein